MQPLPPVALLSSMWVGGGGAPCHSGVGGGGAWSKWWVLPPGYEEDG